MIGVQCVWGAADRPPNIILIFTDDQGYQDLGCFGSNKIETPNLDRMAAEGRRFTSFYVSSSICSPSRASLMTGCYAKRVGMEKSVVFPPDTHGLNPEEVTLAEMFKDAGYATGMIGKWHLGHTAELLPMKQGFDSFYGSPYSNDMTMSPLLKLATDVVFRNGITRENMMEETKKRENRGVLMRGDEVIEVPADQSLWTQRYTHESIDFIQSHRDKPFFLYLAHSMPHLPVDASKEFKGKSSYGPYGDTIEEIDWSTGEIVKALQNLSLDQKTLIIYTSDNGPWHLRAKGEEIDHVGCALPLREGKAMPWEGGLRVPTIMWGPGMVPSGSVCAEMVTTMDLYPTLAKLACGRLPSDRMLDGVDISELIFSKSPVSSPRTTMLYYSTNGTIIGLRRGAWKLLVHNETTMNKHRQTNAGRAPDPVELFNLDSDISESLNLVDEYPELVAVLKKQMQAMDQELINYSRSRWK
jgi:arylsulfatase A-like enzyme